MKTALVLLVAVAFAPCVVRAQAPGAFQIRVGVADALVQPLKDPDHYWDGVGPPLGQAPSEAERNANTAMQQAIVSGVTRLAAGSNPYAAVAQISAGLINNATHSPDVYAVVRVDGAVVARTAFVPNSITPAWSGPSAIVSVTPRSVIEITFWDKDLEVDDQIGICRWLNLRPHSDTYIAVDTECSGGVLHAQLLVQPSDAGSQQASQTPQPPTADSPVPTTPSLADDSMPTRAGNARNGFVQIVTPGGWANVIDARGRPLGQSPMRIEMRAGHQRLRLVPFGTGAPITVDVAVPRNDSTTVSVPVAQGN